MTHERHPAARLAALFLAAAATARCASSVSGVEPGPAADAGPADAVVADAVVADTASGDAPPVVAPAPRLVAPLSTSEVTSHRPTLRWAAGAGTRAVRVLACADRALTRDCRSVESEGASARVPLAPGVWYWQARALDARGSEGAPSPVWQLRVGPRDHDVDTSRPGPLDANSDGYADHLTVAALRPRRGPGDVAVHFGGPAGVAASPDALLERRWGEADEGPIPWRAGDVDGDGYGDVVVSAVTPVRVYRGGAPGLAPAYELPIAVPDGPVVAAGDLDADGYADIVVSASDGRRARAVVCFGSARGPGRTQTLVSAVGGVPAVIAAAGDVNGDGYADLLAVVTRDGAGGVELYLGGPDGPARATTVLANDPIDDAGQLVVGAGDLNGDGYSDALRVNAYTEGAANSFATVPRSRLRVYLGGPDGLRPGAERALEARGDGAIELAFARPDTTNDLNGDGYDDAVLGAIPGPSGGGLYVLFGEPSLADAGLRALAAPPGDGSFTADFAGGDANGDGYDDLLLGSVGDRGAATFAYYGSPAGLRAPDGALTTAEGTDAQPYVYVHFAR